MVDTADLEAAIRLPTESLTRDFKREFGWDRLGARLELCRDIACLANRAGGVIIVGVEDNHGSMRAIGLRHDDQPPDATEVNKLLAKYFDPQPVVEITTYEVDGHTFGLVLVPEFSDAPHVCKASAEDEEKRLILREADMYRRSDRLECARADAGSVSQLIDSAIAKRGITYRRMFAVGEPALQLATQAGEEGRSEPAKTETASEETQRALQLWPGRDPSPLGLHDLQKIVGEATVRNRLARPVVPRGIEIGSSAPGEIVRAPRGILVEHAANEEHGTPRVVLEVSRQLHVVVHETLWEDIRFPGAKRLDISTLIAFAAAGFVFAKRLYKAAGITEASRVDVGLLGPLGRVLVADPTKFLPFMVSYVATSPVDLWISQYCEVDVNPGGIESLVRSTIAGFAEFFGWDMKADTFDAQYAYMREMLGVPELG